MNSFTAYSLHAGDQIQLQKSLDDNWWKVQLVGAEGKQAGRVLFVECLLQDGQPPMERPPISTTKKPISTSLDAGKRNKRLGREKSGEGKPTTIPGPSGALPSPREYPEADTIGAQPIGAGLMSSAPTFALPVHTASKSDDGQLSSRLASQPSLTSPRKSQSAVTLAETSKVSVVLPPTTEEDDDPADPNFAARKSFKKRASQVRDFFPH